MAIVKGEKWSSVTDGMGWAEEKDMSRMTLGFLVEQSICVGALPQHRKHRGRGGRERMLSMCEMSSFSACGTCGLLG